DNFRAQRDIGHRARHYANLADDRSLADRRAKAAVVRCASCRGLEARDAAEGGRVAQAAADVGAQSQRRAARPDDRRLAAAAAAGSTLEVPGVVGRAIHWVVALDIE